MMGKPKWKLVPSYHWPLPEGSPPIITNWVFVPNDDEPEEVQNDPVSDMVKRMLERPPSGDGGDGGAKVPLQPPPQSPGPSTAISTAPRPLPKILRA